MTDVLRHAPMQPRANQTVEKIRAAALTLYNLPDVGRERLTTGMVAALAGVSIGTVYRYYADRVAIVNEIEEHRIASAVAVCDEVIRAHESRTSDPWPATDVVDLMYRIRDILLGAGDPEAVTQ